MAVVTMIDLQVMIQAWPGIHMVVAEVMAHVVMAVMEVSSYSDIFGLAL